MPYPSMICGQANRVTQAGCLQPSTTPLNSPRRTLMVQVETDFDQSLMARGIHGVPKVSPGPAMLDPSTPCERATPETALRLFLGWPARRPGNMRPSSTPLDTPRRTGLEGRELRKAGIPRHPQSGFP
jgi:hypothetical protein